MRSFFKSIVNFFLKFINLEISRKLPFKKISFDEIHLSLNNKQNNVIFDVGASTGQSIDRFKNLFPDSFIHSFEPIKEDFEILKKKYENDKTIKLNDLALGEKKDTKKLYITAKSDCSSFNKVNMDSNWLKIRSGKLKISPQQFTVKTQDTEVTTIDEYVKLHNINKIDLLKIDTQGTEDKVLEGAQDCLKKNMIRNIETEICFSDQYERRLSFYEIEKYLHINNYRLYGIRNDGFRNLKEGFIFFMDVIYTCDSI